MGRRRGTRGSRWPGRGSARDEPRVAARPHPLADVGDLPPHVGAGRLQLAPSAPAGRPPAGVRRCRRADLGRGDRGGVRLDRSGRAGRVVLAALDDAVAAGHRPHRIRAAVRRAGTLGVPTRPGRGGGADGDPRRPRLHQRRPPPDVDHPQHRRGRRPHVGPRRRRLGAVLRQHRAAGLRPGGARLAVRHVAGQPGVGGADRPRHPVRPHRLQLRRHQPHLGRVRAAGDHRGGRPAGAVPGDAVRVPPVRPRATRAGDRRRPAARRHARRHPARRQHRLREPRGRCPAGSSRPRPTRTPHRRLPARRRGGRRAGTRVPARGRRRGRRDGVHSAARPGRPTRPRRRDDRPGGRPRPAGRPAGAAARRHRGQPGLRPRTRPGTGVGRATRARAPGPRDARHRRAGPRLRQHAEPGRRQVAELGRGRAGPRGAGAADSQRAKRARRRPGHDRGPT